MAKIGRNDPCWCGSGKKYKKCHLLREAEERVPIGKLVHEVKKKRKFQTCLHPQASETTCNKIISAHTLQRSRVLKEICDEKNSIRTFYPPHLDETGNIKLHTIGWHNASTFNAFCKLHDDAAFAALEKVPFSGSLEQIFLIAYRAICFEFYQKTSGLRVEEIIRDNIDKGVDEETQRYAQSRIAAQWEGLEIGSNELLSMKKRMDDAFLSKDYSSYRTCEIVLEGKPEVVATGAVSPVHLLNGEMVQNLTDRSNPVQGFGFGTDVNGSRLSVVFCWPKEYPAVQRYIEDILSLAKDKIPEFLHQFFFLFCENTYFSKAWWSGLSEKQKRYVRRLVRNVDPYMKSPQFDLSAGISSLKLVETKY